MSPLPTYPEKPTVVIKMGKKKKTYLKETLGFARVLSPLLLSITFFLYSWGGYILQFGFHFETYEIVFFLVYLFFGYVLSRFFIFRIISIWLNAFKNTSIEFKLRVARFSLGYLTLFSFLLSSLLSLMLIDKLLLSTQLTGYAQNQIRAYLQLAYSYINLILIGIPVLSSPISYSLLKPRSKEQSPGWIGCALLGLPIVLTLIAGSIYLINESIHFILASLYALFGLLFGGGDW